MRKPHALVPLFVSGLLWMLGTPGVSPVGAQTLSPETLRLQEPITFRRLTLFPVSFVSSAPSGKGFILLDEGLEEGTVVITELATREPGNRVNRVQQAGENTLNGQTQGTEQRTEQLQQAEQVQQAEQRRQVQQDREIVQTVSTGAQVNTLAIRNDSDRPLYLLAGEIIHGAKQDRMIAYDVVIPPRSKEVKLEVFCVEAGRWRGESATFSSAKAVAGLQIRSTAQVERAQGKVWEQVSRYNKAVGAKTETNTLRAAFEQRDVQEAVTEYLQELSPKLAGVQRLAGVVVAIDGVIVASDLFGVEGLFERLQGKLITGYVLDAVARDAESASEARGRARSPATPEAAAVYLRTILTAPARPQEPVARGRESGGQPGELVHLLLEAGEVQGVRTLYRGRELHLNSFR